MDSGVLQVSGAVDEDDGGAAAVAAACAVMARRVKPRVDRPLVVRRRNRYDFRIDPRQRGKPVADGSAQPLGVGSGMGFLGRETKKRPVVYVNYEMPEDYLQTLLRAGDCPKGAFIINRPEPILALETIENIMGQVENTTGMMVIDSFRGAFKLQGEAENQARSAPAPGDATTPRPAHLRRRHRVCPARGRNTRVPAAESRHPLD